MSTAAIMAAMRLRYRPPEWALMFEVGNATGHRTNRHADAVAMSLWPSRGLEVHGFEFKASRGDWIKELKDPAKAESIAQFCDRWWLVTPAGLVKEGELPAGWGLLELKERGLHQTKAAPDLAPVPLTRPFIAAMLRRASEADAALVNEMVNQKLAKLREELKRSHDATIKREVDVAARDARNAMKKVEDIKAATGIDLLHWHASDEVAKLLRFAQSANLFNSYGGIEALQRDAAAFASRLAAAQKAFAGAAEAETSHAE